jgi:predicted nucleic acid-binding protein
MGLFLDTGFYCGLVDHEDEHSGRSLELLKLLKSGRYGQIYTSNYVMAETATLIAIRTNRNPNYLQAVRDLFVGNNVLAILLRANLVEDNEAWKLFVKINSEKKSEKVISYIDCTNIIISQSHNIKNIVSFDPHFDGWLSVVS